MRLHAYGVGRGVDREELLRIISASDADTAEDRWVHGVPRRSRNVVCYSCLRPHAVACGLMPHPLELPLLCSRLAGPSLSSSCSIHPALPPQVPRPHGAG